MGKKDTSYDRFVSSVEIRRIILPKVTWELLKEPDHDSPLSINPDVTWIDPLKLGDTFTEYGAELTLKGKTGDTEELFLKINIVIKLVIEFDKDCFTDENIRLYQFRNAALSLMAILREHTRAATVQMGLPQLILPTFKIIPNHNPKKVSTKKISAK